MSDEEENEGKKKSRGDTRDKSLTEPVPAQPKFFEWFEKLFDGSTQFPEKIDLRVVEGKKLDRHGPIIKQIVYPPTAVKPTREQLVSLSNEFLHLMQRDCDIQRRSIVYGVYVMHFKMDADYYERYLHRFQPGTAYSRDGEPREGEDDEMTVQERHAVQMLSHQERMFELYAASFEGMMDRMDRIVMRADERIEKQDARIEKQSEMLERALSLEAEREDRRAWNKLKIEGAQKGLDMVVGIAPPLLNQLMGKQVVPTKESAESITLKNFLESLSLEQSDLVLGKYSDQEPHDVVRPGALTFAQAKLIFDVSQCNVPVDDLDKLMPGGELEISTNQFMALSQCGLSMPQIAPLQILFESRRRNQQQQENKQGAGQ